MYVTKVKTGDLWCGGGNYCHTGQMDPASDSKDVGGLRETSPAGERIGVPEGIFPPPYQHDSLSFHAHTKSDGRSDSGMTAECHQTLLLHTVQKIYIHTKTNLLGCMGRYTHHNTSHMHRSPVEREHHETTQEPFRAHVKPRSRVVRTKASHRHTHLLL